MDSGFVITISAAAVFSITIANIFFLWFMSRKLKEQSLKYKKKYEKEIHYRKSSEVRLGKIGENLAPFIAGWPWEPGTFRFLGNPVDGIQFSDDKIIFVEIKTGGARLSKSQKKCKQLVNEGKVHFATFRISEDGSKLLMEESD